VKKDIHPQWYPQATVVCACGNTWKTGATKPEIRTDICSACHPFYTGEQRIVDTEGQVDRFMKRLQVRDNISAQTAAREAARTPMDLPLADLGISARHATILAENGMNNVGEFLAKLQADGDEAILEQTNVGRKTLADLKKMLRNRGYDVPANRSAVEAE
jgi:large subunit ribosomal protein L31